MKRVSGGANATVQPSPGLHEAVAVRVHQCEELPGKPAPTLSAPHAMRSPRRNVRDNHGQGDVSSSLSIGPSFTRGYRFRVLAWERLFSSERLDGWWVGGLGTCSRIGAIACSEEIFADDISTAAAPSRGRAGQRPSSRYDDCVIHMGSPHERELRRACRRARRRGAVSACCRLISVVLSPRMHARPGI